MFTVNSYLIANPLLTNSYTFDITKYIYICSNNTLTNLLVTLLQSNAIHVVITRVTVSGIITRGVSNVLIT